MPLLAAFVVGLVLSVISIGVTFLMRPKPNRERERPPSLGDVRVTTATEGRKVPIIWGTVLLSDPNIVWWGNISHNFVTTRIDHHTKIIGFRYFVSFQFALCRGIIDGIRKIRYGKKLVVYDSTLTKSDITFNDVNAFGGEGPNNVGGNGGAQLRFIVHDGSDTTADAHLLALIGADKLPSYEGTAYLVMKNLSSGSNRGGYLGNSPNFRQFDFEVSRFPDNLGLTGSNHIINSLDANPAEVIYEILTDEDWGLGLSPADIDTANFQAVGDALFAEGNGFSFKLDSARDPIEIVREVERQINGKLFVDLFTGLFTIKLIRNDYVLGSQPLFDESNIVEVENFGRPPWSSTVNEVRVPFDDATLDFKSTSALAQDGANFEIQGERKVTTIRFPGVKNRQLAADLAWREIRALSYPLAQLTIICNRTAFSLKPGDVFRFTWPDYGITDMPIRVLNVDFGTLQDGRIKVTGIQDVFQTEASAFTAPPESEFQDPVQAVTPFTATDQFVSELPLLIGRYLLPSTGSSLIFHALVAATDAGGFPYRYEILYGDNPTPSYASLGVNDSGLARVGELRASLAGFTDSMPAQGAGSFFVDARTGEDLQDLAVGELATDAINGEFRGVAVIDPSTVNEEYIIYQECLVDGTSGAVELRQVIRGALDTVPKAHSANAPIWFVSEGGFTIPPREFDPADDISFKLLGETLTDKSTEMEQSVDLDLVFPAADLYRAGRPYPPNELQINGVTRPASPSADFDISEGSEPTTPGFNFVWTRRDLNGAKPRENALGQDDDGKTDWGNSEGANVSQRWNVWLYDLETTPSPTGRGQAVLALSSEVGGTVSRIRVTREQIVAATTGNILPNSMRIEIESEHDAPGSDNVSGEVLEYDFTPTSELQSAYPLGDIPYDDLEPDAMDEVDVSALSGLAIIRLQHPLDPHGDNHSGTDFVVELDASEQGITALSATLGARPGIIGTALITSVDRLQVRHRHGTGDKIPFQIEHSGDVIAYGRLVPDETAAGTEGDPVRDATHNFGWVEYEESSVLKDILSSAATNAWTVPKDYDNLEISVPNLGAVTTVTQQETTAGLEEGIYMRIDYAAGGSQVFKLPHDGTVTSVTLPTPDVVFPAILIPKLKAGDEVSLAANVVNATAAALSRPVPFYFVDNDAGDVVATGVFAAGSDAEYSSFTTHGANILANVGTTGPPTMASHGTSIGTTGLRADQRLVARLDSSIAGTGRQLWLYVNGAWVEVTELPQAEAAIVLRVSEQSEIRVWHNWADGMPGTTVNLNLHDWDIDLNGDSDRSKIFEIPLERDE